MLPLLQLQCVDVESKLCIHSLGVLIFVQEVTYKVEHISFTTLQYAEGHTAVVYWVQSVNSAHYKSLFQ